MTEPHALGRENNFDFLRFAAATLVIVSHAFPLTTGDPRTEPLTAVSGGQTSMGHLAVGVFFVISGILITQSFDRSRDLASFARARVLRIFPGLIVAVAVTVLLLGPLVTALPLGAYLSDAGTYRYLQSVTLYRMQFELPGLFESNPYPKTVNGSLWTLWYEFAFYVVVGALGVARLLRRGPVLLALACAAVALPFLPAGGQLHHMAEFFLYYGAGMCLYLFRDRVRRHDGVALLSLALLVGTALAGRGFPYAFALGGSYLVFHLAYAPWLRMNGFARRGDLSYGMYIYAFPIQQTLVYLAGGRMHWAVNTALAVPLTLALAYASWHAVEKPALAAKNRPLLPALLGRLRPAVQPNA